MCFFSVRTIDSTRELDRMTSVRNPFARSNATSENTSRSYYRLDSTGSRKRTWIRRTLTTANASELRTHWGYGRVSTHHQCCRVVFVLVRGGVPRGPVPRDHNIDPVNVLCFRRRVIGTCRHAAARCHRSCTIGLCATRTGRLQPIGPRVLATAVG